MREELPLLLVEMINDYLDFIANSDTLNKQNLHLTNNEMRVMGRVYQQFQRNEPCNLSFLIEQTGINKATISRILTTLFEYGLIREEADENDRRVRLLFPTESGEESMQRVRDWLQGWVEKIDKAAQQNP